MEKLQRNKSFVILVSTMTIIPFRYLFALLPALSAMVSFAYSGFAAWTTVIFVFGFIPLLELILGSGGKFGQDDQRENLSNQSSYDLMLYLVVPVHFLLIFMFFKNAQSSVDAGAFTFFGRAFAMGILCGSFGINVAHELGHRQNKFDQFLAKMLLLSSLYMHFFIEHNRGHHKYVGTPEDPSSGRKNETVYTFWFRSMFFVWVSAWNLEFERLKRLNKAKFHFTNQMLQFQMIQVLAVIGVDYFGGHQAALQFVLAAFIGALLLETINYIEHYGLTRKKLENGMYEIVTEKHSWNSNHIIGRLLLFELSRHSDHHAKTTKKYQELRSIEEAPQMPTGYPGMMVLSLFAPLWFFVMNRRIAKDS